MVLSDNELIIKAINGDSSSLQELIYRYDKMVLRIAMKYTGDPDDAKDIYQEVFIRVYRSLPGFRFNSEFSTWLFRITTNVCISFKREKIKGLRLFIDDDNLAESLSDVRGESELSPERIFEKSETGERLNKALNTLSPKQRMSFLLKHYEGYKIREIAEMMSCREGTIKKYLFEAVRKLQLKLSGVY